MDDGVHKPLKPSAFRDDPDGAKATVSTQGLTHRELLLDHATTLNQLVRDRSLDTDIGEQLLTDAGFGSGPTVTHDTNVGMR